MPLVRLKSNPQIWFKSCQTLLERLNWMKNQTHRITMNKLPSPGKVWLLAGFIVVVVQVPIVALLLSPGIRETLGSLVYVFITIEALTTLTVFACAGYYLNRPKP
jgi:hypothetical protein